ncbi:hypothetical protein BDY17DRAFT_255131 [Neohortaea acidophila]|uniref:pH-response regulator protein palC n=1 Tax=Neohortaea acidophila TaxID=245834 RepID=A0A6A6PNI6_9PEZI|nr:uncharacterized protein BDY17DRAFT_255131 [Neohortaea acidophila]KAF2480827.1 hypothetical protein BDY17DRAFT_255131 [Neohortaea acidophila]
MPFPYALPTTSSVQLSDFFSSLTHPSLPLTATIKRSVVKDALKKYKRLAGASRESQLSLIRDALTAYIPYLLALNTASSFRDVGGQRVDVEVVKPLEVEWRTTLSAAALPGREAPRVKVIGLHLELAFVLSTLGYVQCLLARAQLKALYSATAPSAEQRKVAVGTAMKQLLEAHGIWKFLLSLPSISAAKHAPVDIQPSTVSALAALALAEANLIAFYHDDPYAAAVADTRDEQNTDWMFKSPTIPKVRARVYATVCFGAADHASQACGLLKGAGGKLDESLIKYANDLRRTARAKGMRFLGVDTELAGESGKAIAWLRGAKKELGFSSEMDEGKRKGLKGLKQSWQERREDRKIEKGGEWGLDAGRYEEARVVEMLEAKWEKENSTVNVQAVPPIEPLLADIPSGREYHSQPPVWQPETLDAEAVASLEAPPDPNQQGFRGAEDDSGDEAVYGQGAPVGAFPGTAAQYGRSGTSSSYY